jgi:Raf kinase inhibitor-like YbhB/YbcL family protein
MNLTSFNFKNKENIPEKYTCEGESISPALTWKDYPKETKSFVLIMDDPDAVGGVWNHWIIYDIPVNITNIKEGKFQPTGAKMGESTNNKKSYVAPCPPKGSGVHNYTFKIYALDIEELKPENLKKSDIQKAMNEHILSEATLIGQVEKKNRFFFF